MRGLRGRPQYTIQQLYADVPKWHLFPRFHPSLSVVGTNVTNYIFVIYLPDKGDLSYLHSSGGEEV